MRFAVFCLSLLIYAMIAAGTALTNTTSETVLASTELPAYSLNSAPKHYHVHAVVIATATNSTDTLDVKVRIGGTTLTGTVVGDSGAVDVANADKVIVDLDVDVRSVTAAGSVDVIVSGLVSAPGAEGTATARVAYEPLTLTASTAYKVEVTGTWSVASSSNSCRADELSIVEQI